MLFEKYKNRHFDKQEIKNNGVTLDIVGLVKKNEKSYKRTFNRVSNYKSNKEEIKFNSIIIFIVFLIIILFNFPYSNPNFRDFVGSIIIPFLPAFVYSKYKTFSLNHPTKSEIKTYNKFKKYSENSISNEKLVRDKLKTIYNDFLCKDLRNLKVLELQIKNLEWKWSNTKDKIDKLAVTKKDKLLQLDPIEFEHYVCGLYKNKGYKAQVTKASGDGGVDVILEEENKKTYVQCKRYRGVVGSPELKKFLGTLIHDGINEGIFVTTGTYSKGAHQVANNASIELLNGDQLIREGIKVFSDYDDGKIWSEMLDNHTNSLQRKHAQVLDLVNPKIDEVERSFNKKISTMKKFDDNQFRDLHRKKAKILRKTYFYYSDLFKSSKSHFEIGADLKLISV